MTRSCFLLVSILFGAARAYYNITAFLEELIYNDFTSFLQQVEYYFSKRMDNKPHVNIIAFTQKLYLRLHPAA